MITPSELPSFLCQFLRSWSVATGVLIASMALLLVVSGDSIAQEAGGEPYMQYGFGEPPTTPVRELLEKEDLLNYLGAHSVATYFCSNSQGYCTCCAAGGVCSTASTRASGVCAVAPDSEGAGGGAASPETLTTLASRPASGGGLMGSPSKSVVVNISAHSLHVAKDFVVPDSDSNGECTSCGGGGDGGSCLDFTMARQNRGRDQTEQSSFGPGWFGSYDLKLHLNSDEVGHVDVFDPSDVAPRRFMKQYSYNGSMARNSVSESGLLTASNASGPGDGVFASYLQEAGSGGNGDSEGVWSQELNGVIKSLELYDVNGALTGTRAGAVKAVVTNFDGVKFEFQVFQIEDVPGGPGDAPPGGGCGPEPQESSYSNWEEYYSAWNAWYMCEMYSGYYGSGGGETTVDNDIYDARLTRILDRTGKSVTITYKQWTPAQLAESPDRQWQIDTVTDATGRVATFSYGTEQVGGRWAVSQITVPGGESIQYEYANGKLSRVVRPGGSESTFSTSFNSDIQHVTMQFNDPAADGANRRKEVWLTSNFTQVTHGSPTPFVNQASQLTRAIINGDDSVGHFALSDGGESWIDFWIYEGAGTLKNNYGWIHTKYATGWELRVDNSRNRLGVAANYEPDYASLLGASAWGTMLFPSAARHSNGVRADYEYDEAGFTSKIRFGDQTYESAEYNDRHQITRYRDRATRVTKYTYDAQGNRLTKEVGILEVTTVTGGDPYGEQYSPEGGYAGGSMEQTTTVTDVVQPEHAIYRWEYYPSGHVSAGLLKTEFDPLWDGSSPDTHRTDFEYNGYGQITKKLAPASVTGQTRPETYYTYNTKRQLESVVDEEGHTVTYAYDLQNRKVKTTYDDGSTEETLYGAGGTPQDGLVVKTKDRRNVVTSYTYDLVGRPTQIVVASAWDASILDGQADDTPITNRNEQSITSYTYVTGTDRPASITRDGAKTDFVYDYRGRVIETRVYPYAGKTLISKKEYQKNRLFAETDPYGRKTYYGYRASDGQMVRVVKAAYPTPAIDPNDPTEGMGGYMGGYMGGNFLLSNNYSVLSLTRDTSLNPLYSIKDSITDSSGNLWQIVDERGTVTETTFNTRSQAVIQLAAKGTPVEAKTETIFDAAGNAVEIRSPRYFDANDLNGFEKCRTVMTYDGANRVLTRTEAPGTAEVGTESYAYDLSGRQKIRVDARGKEWTTTYASCCGHSVSSKNPLGHGSIKNQNAGGLTVHTAGVSDVAGHNSLLNPDNAQTLQETTTKYDALGRSIASTVWLQPLGPVNAESPPIAGFGGIAGTHGLTTQTLHDVDLTDNTGLETTTGITVTNPLGGTYNVSLSAAIAKLGEPISQGGAGITFAAGTPGSAALNINAENEISFNISDAQGRSLISGIVGRVSDAGTASVLRTWSCQVPDTVVVAAGLNVAAGLPTEPLVLESISVDALGNTTKSRSNGLGHTVQSVDQDGNISNVQYDAGGNAVVSRDPNNVGQDCVHDALGRRTQCTDTVGSVTKTGYDKSGQQIFATDAKDKTTYYVFDARGRRRRETDRLNYPTEWEYDATGNLLSLKDAENQVTSYGYNDAGQRITEQYPDHVAGATIGTAGYGIITFSYDALGRRIAKQDQQGDVTSYNFDMSGRMLTRGYVGHASGPLAGQQDTDMFTYDRAGRMLSGVKGRYNNTVTFTYDDRGQQTQETLTTHGQTYTVGYQKNVLGQTTQLQYPDGSLVDRAYTNRGQLLAVNYTPLNGALSSVATFTYDAGGRETQRNLGNGLTTTRSYFADNQIQSIATPTVETLTYTYDANKNPTSETRSGVMAPYSWTTGPIGYDDTDRLIHWQRTNGDSQTWNLSPVHNWTSTTINGELQTRTHGPAHELLTMSGAGVTPSPATLTYDTKGNMTTDDRGCGMTWDFDNMLQSFVANGVTDLKNATYEYDSIGRRVAKNVAETGGTQTTVFVQAGQQVICDYVSAVSSQNGHSKRLYGTEIDNVLMKVDDSPTQETKFWLHPNVQGSTYYIAGQNGTAMARYNYTLYGITNSSFPAEASQRNSSVTPSFTGRDLNDESHFYHFRSRVYSTALGRFLGQDASGSIDGQNLYAAYFVPNHTDPTGNQVKRCRCTTTTWGAGHGGGGSGSSSSSITKATDKSCDDECCAGFQPVNVVGLGFCYGKSCSGTQETLTVDEEFIVSLCNQTAAKCGGKCGKEQCEKEAAFLLRGIDNTWIANIFGLYVGTNTCQRWGFECEKQLANTSNGTPFNNVSSCFKARLVRWKCPGVLSSAHVLIKITFCDGTSVYADNGAMGGGDHIGVGVVIPKGCKEEDPQGAVFQ